MASFLWKNLKKKRYTLLMFCCLMILLSGCGGNGQGETLTININDFVLEYSGNIKLKKIPLKDDDSYEIIDLYEEVGEDLKYKDSLLIAQRYSQGLGINGFVQDNMDILESYNLIIKNVNKTQIQIDKNGEKLDSVLVEYEISEGFVPEIPLLYISQLFILDGDNVLLFSFTSDDQSIRNQISKCFKEVK